MNYRRGLNSDLFRTMRGNLCDFTPIRQLQNDNGDQICSCKGTRNDAKACLERNPMPICPGSTEENNEATDLILAKRICAQDAINDSLTH